MADMEAIHVDCSMYMPLARVTIAAQSKTAYQWINTAAFSTGLLVSNIQDKLIIEQGKVFPQPRSIQLFETDANFETDLFQDLYILECDPVQKGVLSMQTEILVVEQFKQDVTERSGMVEPKEGCNENLNANQTFFISEFANPLSKKYNTCGNGVMLDLVAGISSKPKKLPKINISVIEYYQHFKCLATNRLDSDQCDIFSCILVNKDHAKRLSLYDAEFVELCDVDQSRKSGKSNRCYTTCQIKIVENCCFDVKEPQCKGFVLPTVTLSGKRSFDVSRSVEVKVSSLFLIYFIY